MPCLHTPVWSLRLLHVGVLSRDALQADHHIVRASRPAWHQIVDRYEIVAQIKRGMHFFWPRSEAICTRSSSGLSSVDTPPRKWSTAATTGHAVHHHTGRPGGADGVVRHRAGTRPCSKSRDFSGCSSGDQASKEDLRESLEVTARHARELHAKGKALIDELLTRAGRSRIGFTSLNGKRRSSPTSTAISSSGATRRSPRSSDWPATRDSA